MKLDARFISAVIALILIVAIGYVCSTGAPAEPESVETTSQPEADDELSGILDEAEQALDRAGRASTSEKEVNPYMTEPPKPPSAQFPDEFEPGPQEVYVEPETTRTPEEPLKDEDIPAPSDGISDRKAEFSGDNTEDYEKIEAEKAKLGEFYKDLVSWGSPNTSATRARIKAQEIEEEAEKVREEATSADPAVRDEMLHRAEVMDDYARQLKGTRGSNTKMRYLLYDARQSLQADNK